MPSPFLPSPTSATPSVTLTTATLDRPSTSTSRRPSSRHQRHPATTPSVAPSLTPSRPHPARRITPARVAGPSTPSTTRLLTLTALILLLPPPSLSTPLAVPDDANRLSHTDAGPKCRVETLDSGDVSALRSAITAAPAPEASSLGSAGDRELKTGMEERQKRRRVQDAATGHHRPGQRQAEARDAPGTSASGSGRTRDGGDVVSRRDKVKNPPAAGYYDPADKGGNMLTFIPGNYTVGLGEPLNVIISANSDKNVLTDEGFRLYMTSIKFGPECLGQHLGAPQAANLGDGRGYVNQTEELRYNFGNTFFGTCQESIEGGNHIRYWTQSGKEADSGAIFMAASYEMNVSSGHNIVINGYDLARDLIVGNATSGPGGNTSYNGNVWSTTADYIPAGVLMNATSLGINHNGTATPLNGTTIDGRVALLTVRTLVNANGALGFIDPSAWTTLFAMLASVSLSIFFLR